MAPTTPATAEPAKPNKRGRPSITAIAVRDGQQRTIGASIAMAANRLAAAESFAPAVATSNNGPLPEHSCCSSCDTPPHAGAHGGGSSASHAQNEDGSQQSPQREPFAAGQQQAGDEATRRASLLAVLSVGLMGRAVASASQRHLARQPGAPPAPSHSTLWRRRVTRPSHSRPSRDVQRHRRWNLCQWCAIGIRQLWDPWAPMCSVQWATSHGRCQLWAHWQCSLYQLLLKTRR